MADSTPPPRWPDPDPRLEPLWEAPGTHGLLHPDIARLTLEISGEHLTELVTDGRLDAVLVAGQVWTRPDQVRSLSGDMLTERAHTRAARLATARELLRDFLAGAPISGDYSDAAEHGAILLTARRGARHRTHGLHRHRLVFPLRTLSRWGADRAEQHPQFHTLPAGPVFGDTIVDLDGVADQGNVTALNDPPQARPHRVRHWVAVDPALWPVTLPEALARRVAA